MSADAVRLYEQRKAEFLRINPQASADEYEAFCRALAAALGL